MDDSLPILTTELLRTFPSSYADFYARRKALGELTANNPDEALALLTPLPVSIRRSFIDYLITYVGTGNRVVKAFGKVDAPAIDRLPKDEYRVGMVATILARRGFAYSRSGTDHAIRQFYTVDNRVNRFDEYTNGSLVLRHFCTFSKDEAFHLLVPGNEAAKVRLDPVNLETELDARLPEFEIYARLQRPETVAGQVVKYGGEKYTVIDFNYHNPAKLHTVADKNWQTPALTLTADGEVADNNYWELGDFLKYVFPVFGREKGYRRNVIVKRLGALFLLRNLSRNHDFEYEKHVVTYEPDAWCEKGTKYHLRLSLTPVLMPVEVVKQAPLARHEEPDYLRAVAEIQNGEYLDIFKFYHKLGVLEERIFGERLGTSHAEKMYRDSKFIVEYDA